jgi:hypothetical protein
MRVAPIVNEASYRASNNVSILLGSGDGTFKLMKIAAVSIQLSPCSSAPWTAASDSLDLLRVEVSSSSIRITQGAFAIWLDPFGMLDPQVVVNLVPKLGVGVDLVMHGHWLGKRFTCGAGRCV